MRGDKGIAAAWAASFMVASLQCAAGTPAETAKASAVDGARTLLEAAAAVPKAASARTIASRAYASASNTVYGGFELANTTTIYILVRGNSLGSLGVTQNYLDAPRVRLYNAQGVDLVTTDGPGYNYCLTGVPTDLAVINYYSQVRGQPVNQFDACWSGVFAAGVYTFSVTPSIRGVTTGAGTGEVSAPTFGEMLFEVTLGP